MTILLAMVNPMAEDVPAPTSETVRVAGDLMALLRDICFYARDPRGKRYKLTQAVDTVLRTAITQWHAQVMAEAAPAAKPKKPKPPRPDAAAPPREGGE